MLIWVQTCTTDVIVCEESRYDWLTDWIFKNKYWHNRTNKGSNKDYPLRNLSGLRAGLRGLDLLGLLTGELLSLSAASPGKHGMLYDSISNFSSSTGIFVFKPLGLCRFIKNDNKSGISSSSEGDILYLWISCSKWIISDSSVVPLSKRSWSPLPNLLK